METVLENRRRKNAGPRVQCTYKMILTIFRGRLSARIRGKVETSFDHFTAVESGGASRTSAGWGVISARSANIF